MNYPPRVLTIAASDSSGAAGAQADLKTFEARGVYGMSALTAITAQNSLAIQGVQFMEPAFVTAQIESVLSDLGADAIKTGLLFRAPIVEAAAAAIQAHASATPLIVDPVLVAGDGRRLVDDATLEAYRRALFPKALIITPNLDEAAILSGRPVDSPTAMHDAARALIDLGARSVLIKGGHLSQGEIIDLLFDGAQFVEYRAVRLTSPNAVNARGAGCTFASCIAAEIAKGGDLYGAVRTANEYVHAALVGAQDWQMGHGRGTLKHDVL